MIGKVTDVYKCNICQHDVEVHEKGVAKHRFMLSPLESKEVKKDYYKWLRKNEPIVGGLGTGPFRQWTQRRLMFVERLSEYVKFPFSNSKHI